MATLDLEPMTWSIHGFMAGSLVASLDHHIDRAMKTGEFRFEFFWVQKLHLNESKWCKNCT